MTERKKRIMWAAAAVLAGILLTGCGQNASQETGETSSSTAANGAGETGSSTAANGSGESGDEAAVSETAGSDTASASESVDSDNEYIKEVEEILAGIEPLEPYTSIRPEDVPENPESDFIYESAGDYVYITGYQGSSTQVKIPANLGGGTRLIIKGEAFAENTSITWLYLPNTVGDIGDDTFKGCTALQEVYIAGTGSIGNCAFKDCTALRRAEIQSCTELGGSSSSPSGAGVFCGCTSLEEVVFPSDLEVMKTGTFEECVRLKEADLSNTSLIYLAQNAFLDCYSLERISLPVSLQYISGNACLKAYSLTDIQIPEGSTYFVEDNILYGYQDENGANPDHLECVMCLMGAKAEEIRIKDGTKTLTFKGIALDPYIRTVIIPDSVERLDDSALYWLSNMERLELGSGLTYIADSAVLIKEDQTILYQGETYQGSEGYEAVCQKINQ